MNRDAGLPDLSKARRYALTAAGAGLGLSALGALLDPAEFYHAYIWAFWFWLGVAVGCGQLLMLYQLVNGAWGYGIQRILEAATRTFPYMFALAVPLALGIGAYPYAQPELVERSHALHARAPYLNAPFVLARLAVYFAIWWGIARMMNRWSRLLDETADQRYHRKRVALAGPGIILYSLAMTFAAIDWFMTLEAEWFSTMYPGFHLVGQVLAALAVVIIAARYLGPAAPRPETFSPKAFHDLGNLLFTFVVLWGYVNVAQLVITWQGNLPKEVAWYLHRTSGNWKWITLSLAVFHFFVPFFLLLSRRNKLRAPALASIAVYILIVRFVDYWWHVEPAFHTGGLYLHWMSIAAPAGIGGLWVALFLWQLKRRPALPLHDPRLEQALEKA